MATLEIQLFTRIQVSVTFEEWVDCKVARIIEKMNFEMGKGSGVRGTLLNFKG